MAQEIVKTFKELVDRLKASNVEGKLLERATLYEGPIEEVISDENLPAIIYEISNGGIVSDEGFPRCARAEMTARITVITATDCGYYNDEKVAILDLYEKIMNVIDGEDTVDLTGGNNWGPNTPDFRVAGLFRDGFKFVCEIEIDLQSAKYNRGEL